MSELTTVSVASAKIILVSCTQGDMYYIFSNQKRTPPHTVSRVGKVSTGRGLLNPVVLEISGWMGYIPAELSTRKRS
jgi:hypothetical protein